MQDALEASCTKTPAEGRLEGAIIQTKKAIQKALVEAVLALLSTVTGIIANIFAIRAQSLKQQFEWFVHLPKKIAQQGEVRDMLLVARTTRGVSTDPPRCHLLPRADGRMGRLHDHLVP